MQHVILTSFD